MSKTTGTPASNRPKVNCPSCDKVIEYRTDNQYRPFCSERCKVMDLGAWASEQYRVAGSEKPPENPEQGN